MADFNPNLTQRLVARARKRIVPNWRGRLKDYSSRIAQWGALLQGALLMLPATDLAKLPANFSAYLALGMFIAVGAAKLITEPST